MRWQGTTTLRAHARKEEQRRQRAAAWPDRACSAVTHAVMFVGVANVSIHQASPAEESGQLRFLGSSKENPGNGLTAAVQVRI